MTIATKRPIKHTIVDVNDPASQFTSHFNRDRRQTVILVQMGEGLYDVEEKITGDIIAHVKRFQCHGPSLGYPVFGEPTYWMAQLDVEAFPGTGFTYCTGATKLESLKRLMEAHMQDRTFGEHFPSR